MKPGFKRVQHNKALLIFEGRASHTHLHTVDLVYSERVSPLIYSQIKYVYSE